MSVFSISIRFVYTLFQCISVSYIVAFPDLTILDELVIIDRRVGATIAVQLGFVDEAGTQLWLQLFYNTPLIMKTYIQSQTRSPAMSECSLAIMSYIGWS